MEALEKVWDIMRQIGIRWQVLLIQLVGFLLVTAILKVMLFDRVRAFMEKRDEEQSLERSELTSLRSGSAEAERKLKVRLDEIEKQAYEQTQAEVRKGLKRKADDVSAAHDKAHDMLLATRAAVAEEHQRALASIDKQIIDLSVEVACTAMGQKAEKRHTAIAEAAVHTQMAAWGGDEA